MKKYIVFAFIVMTAALSLPAETYDKGSGPRSIISYKAPGGDTEYFGDLIEGLEFRQGMMYYTDKQGGSIKVGVFARRGPNGVSKNVKYQAKVLYPDKDYDRGSIKRIRQNVWFKDLQNTYKRRLKECKSERDKELKLRRYRRLSSWCESNFLFNDAKKIGKEVDRLVKAASRKEVVEEEAWKPTEDPEERDRILAEVYDGLKEARKVVVCSSRHVVIASDYLGEQRMERMLEVCERVYDDFKAVMYDPGLPDSKRLPDEEILRYFCFARIETFEEAMRTGQSFGPWSNVKSETEIERALKMGAHGFGQMKSHRVLKVEMVCAEKMNPDDPSKVDDCRRDFEDTLVHQLGHSLIENRLRTKMIEGPSYVTPWLNEGMAMYMTIKHLGTRNTFCVDFRKKEVRYEEDKEQDDEREFWSDSDIELAVSQFALSDGADKFTDMIRVTRYNDLKPQTLAKAVSMIDFLIERDRVGFLRFLEALQKHYKLLFRDNDLKGFWNGLDGLVKESFMDEDRGDDQPINSVKSLESAWRSWAEGHGSAKKRK